MSDQAVTYLVEEADAALAAGQSVELLVAGEWHQLDKFGPSKEGLVNALLKNNSTIMVLTSQIQAVRYRAVNSYIGIG